MQSIRVEPAKLLKVAQNIDTVRDDYKRLYTQLYATVDRLSSVWQGKDNQAFIAQIRGFEDNFRRINVVMNQYSDFLRNSTQGYETTQNELYSQAMRLRR